MKIITFVLLGLLMALNCTAKSPTPFHSSCIDNSLVGHSITSVSNTAAFNDIEAHSFNYKTTKEWKKYKALRAVGWSALGLGIPVTFGGLVGVGVSAIDGDSYGGFIAMLAAGGVLTLSSIPILISAYHYRKKAKKIALELRMASVYNPTINNRQSFQPALGLTLRF